MKLKEAHNIIEQQSFQLEDGNINYDYIKALGFLDCYEQIEPLINTLKNIASWKFHKGKIGNASKFITDADKALITFEIKQLG